MTPIGIMDERARVRLNIEVAQHQYLARLEAPELAAGAAPGQFVEVRPGDQASPLLRLPLSLGGRDPGRGTVDLLYESVGPKSQLISRLEPGCEVACLGPLGKGFERPARGQRAILVGGGIGVPPLLFLAADLRQHGCAVVLLVGARSAAQHLPDSLLHPVVREVHRATDDGSLGHAGMVTDLLQGELASPSECAVFCCGPQAMMAAVARLCRDREIVCQVSLEEYMACGFGVCMGCAVEVVPPDDAPASSPYTQYSRVCVDGPVFDARRVRW